MSALAATLAEQIHFERQVDDDGQAGSEVVDLPDLAVGEDRPLDALVDGVHLDLPQVLGTELGGAVLDLDERDLS